MKTFHGNRLTSLALVAVLFAASPGLAGEDRAWDSVSPKELDDLVGQYELDSVGGAVVCQILVPGCGLAFRSSTRAKVVFGIAGAAALVSRVVWILAVLDGQGVIDTSMDGGTLTWPVIFGVLDVGATVAGAYGGGNYMSQYNYLYRYEHTPPLAGDSTTRPFASRAALVARQGSARPLVFSWGFSF